MENQHKKYSVDVITVVAIAAIAISLTVGGHEGVHAATCLLFNGDLHTYSALYVDCAPGSVLQDKVVAASAMLVNLLVGFLLLFWLRRSKPAQSTSKVFLWLLMFMNFAYGCGYLLFSGIFNVGDLAQVIIDFKNQWIYQIAMVILGSVIFMGSVWLALKELGIFIGGKESELYRRARLITIPAYFTSVLVVVLASIACPLGWASFPAIAGMGAVAGALSPLLWMTEWFHAPLFTKDTTRKPLEISRSWGYVITACITVFLYVVVLGQR